MHLKVTIHRFTYPFVVEGKFHQLNTKIKVIFHTFLWVIFQVSMGRFSNCYLRQRRLCFPQRLSACLSKKTYNRIGYNFKDRLEMMQGIINKLIKCVMEQRTESPSTFWGLWAALACLVCASHSADAFKGRGTDYRFDRGLLSPLASW